MKNKDRKHSLAAIVCMILTAISVAVLFIGKLFYVAMFTSVAFAIAALVFSIIGAKKTKSAFTIITLIVSVVVLVITSLFIEMLFEYIFIL